MLNTVGYYAEFIKLCETGNLFEAADELYLSESCLLKHMHLLDEDIGHELFSKCSKQVELTEYGALYLSFAYNMKACDRTHDELRPYCEYAFRPFSGSLSKVLYLTW